MAEASEPNEGRMSFIDHLRELRGRIIYTAVALVIGTFVAFAFRVEIFTWITAPLNRLSDSNMQVLGLVEMFVAYLKLAVLASLFACIPWVLLQTWLFVAPGLYSHEKRWILPFIFLGTLFFIGGGLFAFYIVLPLGFEYLVQMVPEGIDANYRVSDYIALVIRLLLAFGIVFELPLVMWILAAAGIAGPELFAKLRKYWVVIAVTLAAFLTPPDPLTQMMMAVPLVVFFELGMLGARLLYKKPE